jgi:hypothetical protein
MESAEITQQIEHRINFLYYEFTLYLNVSYPKINISLVSFASLITASFKILRF